MLTRWFALRMVAFWQWRQERHLNLHDAAQRRAERWRTQDNLSAARGLGLAMLVGAAAWAEDALFRLAQRIRGAR